MTKTRTGQPTIAALRSAIERRLGELAPSPDLADALNGAVRYALLAPGKRLRPLLALLAAAELGRDDLAVLDAACAVEMIHAASLVLDDLPSMDDARWRRGQPSTHAQFGEDVAILAAVALIGRAFATVAGCQALDVAARGTVVAALARTLGPDGLAGGQLADLRGGAAGSPLDRIFDTNHLKTGVLFLASVDTAIAGAGAGGVVAERLRRSAIHLGQAFQLYDDLRDGKSGPGSDSDGEDSGKVTALSLLGPDQLRTRMEQHIADALDGLQPAGPLATLIRTMFDGERAPAAPADQIGA